jgi:hypothetical protein
LAKELDAAFAGMSGELVDASDAHVHNGAARVRKP